MLSRIWAWTNCGGSQILGIVRDRRGQDRYRVDVQFDDLQSEMEAAARTLDKIQIEASILHDHVCEHPRQAGLASRLKRQIKELGRSMMQQRATLRALRDEMRELRAHAARDSELGLTATRATGKTTA